MVCKTSLDKIKVGKIYCDLLDSVVWCMRCQDNFFLVHLTLSFLWRETRNLSDIFILLFDLYPRPSWRTISFNEYFSIHWNYGNKASTSGASCNQKDQQEKEKAKNDTWSQSLTMTLLDTKSSNKDGFESELYLGKLFPFYI